MANWSDKFALVVVTLWVGALWTIGYIVAPALFHQLQDRQLAGNLAGELFTLVAYVGFASALYLLLQRLLRFGSQALKQGFFWSVILMLLLTLAGHFGIQPLMAALKAQAMPADVMNSVFASRFKTWHGISSVAYLIQSLLGLVLIFKVRQ